MASETIIVCDHVGCDRRVVTSQEIKEIDGELVPTEGKGIRATINGRAIDACRVGHLNRIIKAGYEDASDDD